MSSQPTILLAEDSESDTLLIKIGFEEARLPFAFQFVTDGAEAIDYLSGEGQYGDRTKYPLPCLLLTDLKMPRINGFELVTWVRSQEAWRHLPVIVLSGSDQPEDQERAMQLGAKEYVVKDLLMRPLPALNEAIMRLCGSQIREAAPAEKKRGRAKAKGHVAKG